MMTTVNLPKTPVVNMNRKRGDTRAIVLVVQEGSVNLDISGWTNFLLTVTTIKNPPDNTTEVFQVSGFFVSDGTDSKIAFIPPGTTDIGTYYYDIQGTDPAGGKLTIVEGKYKLAQDRTKD